MRALRNLLVFLALIGLSQIQGQAIEFPTNQEEEMVLAPNATANEVAIYINSKYLGKDTEALSNMVESLVLELDETVVKSGTMFAKVYTDELPKFTKGWIKKD